MAEEAECKYYHDNAIKQKTINGIVHWFTAAEDDLATISGASLMDIIVLPAAKEMGIRFARMGCILKCLPAKSRGCVSHCMHELHHITHADDENHSGENDGRMDGHEADDDYDDYDSMFEDYEDPHNVHDDYYDDNDSDEFKPYYHDDRDEEPVPPAVIVHVHPPPVTVLPPAVTVPVPVHVHTTKVKRYL